MLIFLYGLNLEFQFYSFPETTRQWMFVCMCDALRSLFLQFCLVVLVIVVVVVVVVVVTEFCSRLLMLLVMKFLVFDFERVSVDVRM